VTDAYLQTQITRSRGWLNEAAIPHCLVTLGGSRCVGTISIFVHDLPAREDLTPWLAAFYAEAAHRNQGVGGALMDPLLEVARSLGI
jgi:GNAT superfamily N-acetyltransferase